MKPSQIFSLTQNILTMKNLLLLPFLLLTFSAYCQLATWEFTGSSLSPTTTATGVTAINASPVGLTSTASFFSCNGDAWSPSSWSTAATVNTAGDYAEYTISAATGFDLTVTGMTYTARRSNSGPTLFSIRTSDDSFAAEQIGGSISTSCSGKGGTFPSAITVLAGNSLTIRIYGYSASGTGNMRMDDVTITGTAALAGGGGGPAEINLQSSSTTTIMNGDVSPSVAKGTDFGTVETGATSTSTITIQNTGGSDLTTGAITISGTDMADFAITNYTAGAIGSLMSMTFDIEFTPSSLGTKNAMISIVNDDADENPYEFDITGEGFSLEEIAITEFSVNPNSSGIEFIEIYNYGATPIDLMGWRIKDEDTDNNVISTTSLIIEAGAYLILADNNKAGFETNWFNGASCDQVVEVVITLANGTDEIILENGNGDVVWSLAYQNDDAAGVATYYTEATFTNRFWGSKASPGVDRDGNDVTGSLGYERNNVTADALAFSSANSDTGSPLNRTACYEAEIDIQGGASLTSIMSGDATPETADGTEVIALIGMASTQTFTIENQGIEDLTISNITSDNGDFSISGATFPLVVTGGMTVTFAVEFTSTMIGTATATITVANDDADEAIYTFDVEAISPDLTLGDGCSAAVTAAVDASGTMVHFLDASNRLVASMSSTGTDFSASGDEIDIYTNVGSGRSDIAADGSPYLIMGRQFNIESTVTAPYAGLTVRLYFNNSDYSDLSAVSCPTCPALTTPSDLELSHYSGANQNCDQSDNDYSATPSENLGGSYGTYGSTAFYIDVNPAHFSEFFGHQTNSIVFPVELTSFLAEKSGSDNILHWQTATEINNELFVIERKDDVLGWEKIGEVRGAGDSTDPIDYSFTDKNQTNTQYYRLKQIDFDGQFAYSEIVSVARRENANRVSEFYPNPSNSGNVSIDYTSTKNEELVVSGFDIGGKLVFHEIRTVTTGSNQLSFNLKDLDTGLYIIELQTGDQQIQRKLLLD